MPGTPGGPCSFQGLDSLNADGQEPHPAAAPLRDADGELRPHGPGDRQGWLLEWRARYRAYRPRDAAAFALPPPNRRRSALPGFALEHLAARLARLLHRRRRTRG